MGEHFDAEGLPQELPGDGAGRDAGSGLAGAGPLEHRAGVVEAVFQHAGVVGVAGPRPGQRGIARNLELGRVHRVGGHHRLPLRPFGVADLDGDRAAEGDAVPHPGQHGDLVAFELHPGAAAVAEPAAGQLVRDFFGRRLHPGDHAFQHGHQRPAVGFTSSGPSQHVSHLPTTGACRAKSLSRGRRNAVSCQMPSTRATSPALAAPSCPLRSAEASQALPPPTGLAPAAGWKHRNSTPARGRWDESGSGRTAARRRRPGKPTRRPKAPRAARSTSYRSRPLKAATTAPADGPETEIGHDGMPTGGVGTVINA